MVPPLTISQTTAHTRAFGKGSTASQRGHNQSALSYWQRKTSLAPSNAHWLATGNAYCNLTSNCQLWLPQWLTYFVPLGYQMQQWRLRVQPLCPCCPELVTHRSHVLQCSHSDVSTIWDCWLTNLNVRLIERTTHLDLRHGLMSLLHAWKK